MRAGCLFSGARISSPGLSGRGGGAWGEEAGVVGATWQLGVVWESIAVRCMPCCALLAACCMLNRCMLRAARCVCVVVVGGRAGAAAGGGTATTAASGPASKVNVILDIEELAARGKDAGVGATGGPPVGVEGGCGGAGDQRRGGRAGFRLCPGCYLVTAVSDAVL